MGLIVRIFLFQVDFYLTQNCRNCLHAEFNDIFIFSGASLFNTVFITCAKLCPKHERISKFTAVFLLINYPRLV